MPSILPPSIVTNGPTTTETQQPSFKYPIANAETQAQAPALALQSRSSSPSSPSTPDTLIHTILARHTTRIFHKTPVPMPILEQCLALAQTSPSSTNIQPWRLTFTCGPKLDSLRAAMMTAATSGQKSTVPPIPEQFKQYRSDVGHFLYGPEGYNIPRGQKDEHRQAQLRNYDFFGAPMVAVVGIDQSLMVGGADVMSVGLYVQTLVLLLTERGLGTCLEVSTSGYADVLRRELGIPENIVVLCTLAIGYEDESQRINTYRMKRDEWKDHVRFVMD